MRAGFLSPGIVVIGAITQIFGSTLSSLSLAGTISTLRFFLFILSTTLGIYGFFLGLFIVLSHLASLRSCGLPYLAQYHLHLKTWPTLCFDYLGHGETLDRTC
ncbi:spore germination protein [Bacillus subtilis]